MLSAMYIYNSRPTIKDIKIVFHLLMTLFYKNIYFYTYKKYNDIEVFI